MPTSSLQTWFSYDTVPSDISVKHEAVLKVSGRNRVRHLAYVFVYNTFTDRESFAYYQTRFLMFVDSRPPPSSMPLGMGKMSSERYGPSTALEKRPSWTYPARHCLDQKEQGGGQEEKLHGVAAVDSG